MSTTKLHINLAKYIEGQTIGEGAGVVTNIYATGKGASSKGLRGITIPVTEEDVYRTVELEAGSYLIESVLPSGEIVSESISLEPGEESHRVMLRGKDSPHEWLSWQQLSGNVTRQSFAPDAYRLDTDTTRGDDALDQGLVEIGQGPFRTQAFTGVDQWQTLEAMIGPESGPRLDELMQRSRAARDGAAQSDNLTWITRSIYDDMARVFRLGPASGVEQGEIRDFLYWTTAGAEWIRLPNHWISDDFDEKVIGVMTDLSPDGRKFRSSVTVQDPSFATTLAYLAAGSLPQARLLFAQAREMLHGKRNNPYAAAAGGYLLLGAGSPGPDDQWPQWIENLRNWFPWLPDGAVHLAWLHLFAGNSEAAIGELKEAFQRGIPLYSAGLKRLLDGLSLVAAEDEECRQMERRVRRIAWRANMDQVFTIIRLGAM